MSSRAACPPKFHQSSLRRNPAHIKTKITKKSKKTDSTRTPKTPSKPFEKPHSNAKKPYRFTFTLYYTTITFK